MIGYPYRSLPGRVAGVAGRAFVVVTVLGIFGPPTDTAVTFACLCLVVLAVLTAVRWRLFRWRGW